MRRALAVLILAVMIESAGAATELHSTLRPTPSERATHKVGLILGLNDPVPAVAGISVGYNVLDFLRLTAGVGRFNSDYQLPSGYVLKTKSITYGGGVRFLAPGWNLTPILGFSWATIATEGFPNDDHHVYAVAGLEWQSDFGLNIGAGYERSFDGKIGGLPYLTAGWYTDLW